MNSESVKPLLSVEEINNAAAKHYPDTLDRPPSWFLVAKEMKRDAFAKGAEWAASQLHPPQLEQEVKRLQEENARLQKHVEDTRPIFEYIELEQKAEKLKEEVKEQENGLVEAILSEFRSIDIDTSNWEQAFGDGRFAHEFIAAGVESVLEQKNTRIKELEQQLSQSDAVRFGQYLLKNFKTQYEDEVSADCWMDKRPPFRTMATEFAYALFLAKGNHRH